MLCYLSHIPTEVEGSQSAGQRCGLIGGVLLCAEATGWQLTANGTEQLESAFKAAAENFRAGNLEIKLGGQRLRFTGLKGEDEALLAIHFTGLRFNALQRHGTAQGQIDLKLATAGNLGPGQCHAHGGGVGRPLNAIRGNQESLRFIGEQWRGLPTQALWTAGCLQASGGLAAQSQHLELHRFWCCRVGAQHR